MRGQLQTPRRYFAGKGAPITFAVGGRVGYRIHRNDLES